MSDVLSGTNWEVRREFIPRSEALYAGVQARYILDEAMECVEELVPTGAWDGDNMTVYRVDVNKLIDFWTVGTTTLNKTGILYAYDQTEEEANNGLDEFFLNIYSSFGSTTKHKDAYEIDGKKARSTIAVGLFGEGVVEIEDPSTGEEHVIDLYPGDALHLNNDVPEEEKPLHLVRNSLSVPRIALVNG